MAGMDRAPSEAYASELLTPYHLKKAKFPTGLSAAFRCAYCSVVAKHQWGAIGVLTAFINPNTSGQRHYDHDYSGALVSALCENCHRETVFKDGVVIWPVSSAAPMPAKDMPKQVSLDYQEARMIAAASPRGAAALLRLVIQKLLPLLGSTKPTIDTAIGELVANGTISANLQKALDTVRVVGNEAVHPGSIDLNDDPATAMSLFHLVNFIIEKAITEPNEIGAIYNALPPAKLKGIDNRDRSKV